jgi:DnaJ-domain-containing protein 1
MIDYSEPIIKLTALILQYRKLLHKQNYELAANCAVEMQFMAMQLQEWAESKCIETPKS